MKGICGKSLLLVVRELANQRIIIVENQLAKKIENCMDKGIVWLFAEVRMSSVFDRPKLDGAPSQSWELVSLSFSLSN